MLTDADKGELVVRYVLAYIKRCIWRAAAWLPVFCAITFMSCILLAPLVAFGVILLLQSIFGDNNTLQNGRHYRVG